MTIGKHCPFCNRYHSLDLLKLVGEVSECPCGALYLLDIDDGLLRRLELKAIAVKKYNPKDEREGVLIDDGKVFEYGDSDCVYLRWTRRNPTVEDVRSGIHAESGDWIFGGCGCSGQLKITGIFPIDEKKMICYACENKKDGEEHESGNFTI